MFCPVCKDVIQINVRRQELFQFLKCAYLLLGKPFGKDEAVLEKGPDTPDDAGYGAFIYAEQMFKDKIDEVETRPDECQKELIFKGGERVLPSCSSLAFSVRIPLFEPFGMLYDPVIMYQGSEPIKLLYRESREGLELFGSLP